MLEYYSTSIVELIKEILFYMYNKVNQLHNTIIMICAYIQMLAIHLQFKDKAQ